MARKASDPAARKVMRWADAIASLGASEDLLKLSKALAQAAKAEISAGFRAEADPYGKPWKERESGDTSRALLVQTGRMKRSFTSQQRPRITPAGFTIRSAVDYAKHHQRGTKKMAARKMVPDTGRLPESWAKEFDHMAKLWQRKVLRRARKAFR